MPEPRAAFGDLAARMTARSQAERLALLPRQARKTPIRDYLKGWISPPPLAPVDKAAIYQLEIALGYEPTERPPVYRLPAYVAPAYDIRYY